MTPSLPVASAKLAESTSVKILSYVVKTPDEERYRLVISIPDQRMALLEGRAVVAEYVISTALKGVISELNPGGEPPVITRLFCLRGHESTNQTTYDRLIYLHGSPHEHLLRQPASGGCIRMSSDDVLALFDTIEVGTWISALQQPLAMAIATTLNREQSFAQYRQKVRADPEADPTNQASPQNLCAGHVCGGHGIPLNYLAARQWCRLAADNSEPSAITLLGELHEFGRIEEPNLPKARVLYEQAAALGHPHALAKAEWMQRKGIGGSRVLLAAKNSATRLAAYANDQRNSTTKGATNAARNPSK